MDKEIATTNNKEKFIIPAENNDIPMDELDGFNLTFDKIKIPAGGTTAFEVPGEDADNPDIEKELKVIIVDHYPVNAYYKGVYDGTETAPDCSSNDGHTGRTKLGETISCDSCSNNRYGSAIDGIGKACKNMRRVFILRAGDTFPMLLTLPATSITPFGKYLQRLVSKGLRSCDVITKIALKKAESKGGITYAQATFVTEEILPPEMKDKVRKYVSKMKDTTRISKVEEFVEEDTGDTDLPF